MKAIIWIIVLALVAWGIWAWVGNDDAEENTGANAAGALDINLSGGADANGSAGDDDIDLTEFEDKG